MIRSLLAGLIGVVVAVVVIFLIEMINSRIYPMPADLDPQDHPRGDPGRANGEVQGVPVRQHQLFATDP